MHPKLAGQLESIVKPELAAAADLMAAHGFRLLHLRVNGMQADLLIRHERQNVTGWLSFQIHWRLDPLTFQRVFWVASVRRGYERGESEGAGMQELDDAEAVRNVVGRFTSSCLGMLRAPSSSNAELNAAAEGIATSQPAAQDRAELPGL
jgi:hypothetical protein